MTDAGSASEPDVKGEALIPAACPLCDNLTFYFVPETGHLICTECTAGFLAHEFIELTKNLRTAQ